MHGPKLDADLPPSQPHADITLGAAFHRCGKRAQERDAKARNATLHMLPSIYGPLKIDFIRSARRLIPGDVLDDIRWVRRQPVVT